jgi:hypothetical protein
VIFIHRPADLFLLSVCPGMLLQKYIKQANPELQFYDLFLREFLLVQLMITFRGFVHMGN